MGWHPTVTSAPVLIDAGNLVSGGGLQVGVSFLTELYSARRSPEFAERFPWIADARIEVSEQLVAALPVEVREELRVQIGHRYGRMRRSRHSVVFVVFGPRYGAKPGRVLIMGFADVTSLFPAEGRLSVRSRLRRRLSRVSFTRADHVVVEAPFLVDELGRRWGLEREKVSVVPNTVNRVFRDPMVRTRRFAEDDVLTLLYVAGAYPHKNHEFLPALGRELLRNHGIRARFRLTLTQEEWDSASEDLRAWADNVGRVPVIDLPRLYGAADAVVFPSLLECFSATPLEAMATGTPLICSDRNFVRDVAGNSACYIDPLNAGTAADAVARFVRDERRVEHGVRSGLDVVSRWPTAKDRMIAYLELIDRYRAGAAR